MRRRLCRSTTRRLRPSSRPRRRNQIKNLGRNSTPGFFLAGNRLAFVPSARALARRGGFPGFALSRTGRLDSVGNLAQPGQRLLARFRDVERIRHRLALVAYHRPDFFCYVMNELLLQYPRNVLAPQRPSQGRSQRVLQVPSPRNHPLCLTSWSRMRMAPNRFDLSCIGSRPSGGKEVRTEQELFR